MKIRLIILLLALTLIDNSLLQGQQNTFTNTLTLLEYGFPSENDYLNARATIANNWGIKFESVAGCIVSEHLIDSVKQHNEEISERIISKFGEDWGIRFKKEVEKELEVQKIARRLVDNQRYIAKLDSTLGTQGNGLYYQLTPINPGIKYSANIFGWGEWNEKTELVTFYKLEIDLDKKKVNITSDKIELFTFE